MIASVQYNDLRVTAAADIADGYMNSLQKYLMDTYEKYNSERYVCRGCTICTKSYRLRWEWNTSENINKKKIISL